MRYALDHQRRQQRSPQTGHVEITVVHQFTPFENGKVQNRQQRHDDPDGRVANVARTQIIPKYPNRTNNDKQNQRRKEYVRKIRTQLVEKIVILRKAYREKPVFNIEK